MGSKRSETPMRWLHVRAPRVSGPAGELSAIRASVQSQVGLFGFSKIVPNWTLPSLRFDFHIGIYSGFAGSREGKPKKKKKKKKSRASCLAFLRRIWALCAVLCY